MARSSGGGSRSGGGNRSSSRSSSSGSRSSSYRSSGSSHGIKTSNVPFSGSRKFRYYRNGSPVYVYSNRDLASMPDPKPRYFAILFYIPFIIAIFSMLGGIISFPEKPMESYNSANVSIIDEADVFTSQEEQELNAVLKEFCDTTGVATQIITIEPEEWLDNGSLNNYAYYRYYAQFDNEDGWLLVYSEENEGAGEWFWEGIQGDNTIDVMDVFINDFNNKVNSELTVSQIADPKIAFEKGFSEATANFKNQSTEFNFGMLPVALFMIAFIGVHAYMMIFAGTKKKYSYKELEEVPNDDNDDNESIDSYFRNNSNRTSGYKLNHSVSDLNPPSQEETECRYCGFKYSDTENNRCPNCNAIN